VIEVGERDEEVGHGGVLATEEIGEAGGEIAYVRHDALSHGLSWPR
jgi:hypothetical protein